MIVNEWGAMKKEPGAVGQSRGAAPYSETLGRANRANKRSSEPASGAQGLPKQRKGVAERRLMVTNIATIRHTLRTVRVIHAKANVAPSRNVISYRGHYTAGRHTDTFHVFPHREVTLDDAPLVREYIL